VKRVVAGVQVLAALCAVAFVVLLFANEPASFDAAPATPADPDAPAAEVDGAAVFADRCASCHGRDGGGGFGPQLSEGRAAAAFPDIEAQIAVVTDGRGSMPSFGGRLGPDEIRAVVAYSRTL
jgi:mono/diheme cytochrome c family protein